MNEQLPPCSHACPVKTDVRGYLAAVARQDYGEAYRLIRANNPFPSVCAWVCPHPCEDHCRRGDVDASLSIRNLKRFAVEKAGQDFAATPIARDNGKNIAIVGSGPAGLTAGLYGARAGMKTLLLEKAMPGGQAALTEKIENYPGYPAGVGGPELMMSFMEQAVRFGLEYKTEEGE
jgi:NADPH-dependent glutamate synthase beta subunit-like oxidoreductase